MSHVLGEMYYLTTQTAYRRMHMEMQQKEQGQTHHLTTGPLVFISPRVPKEFDTVVPSDTGKPVDNAEDWCVIM